MQQAAKRECCLCRYGKFNIQAGTQFCDKSFSEEIARGSISSVSLDKYTCVALAGVSAEYLKFGRAEGGLGDVQQLDALLRAIGVRTPAFPTSSIPARGCSQLVTSSVYHNALPIN